MKISEIIPFPDSPLKQQFEILDNGTLDTVVRYTNTGETYTYNHEYVAQFDNRQDFLESVADDFSRT